MVFDVVKGRYMKRSFVAVVVQLAGIGAMATAGFVCAAALGWAVLGVGLVVFGVAVERDS